MTDLFPAQDLRLAKYKLRVAVRLDEWSRQKVAERFFEKDPELWGGEPAREIQDRLGWLDLPDDSISILEQIEEFVSKVRSQKIKSVFLVGMGGSSLAPEVFESSFGDPSRPFVRVVDSTHPDFVRRLVDEIDSDAYYFIVSSKSGSTLETRSLFLVLWHAMERWHSQAGLRFAAITDPESPLEFVAGRRGFTHVFTAPQDVGGRFSALSAFGLVPAALSGVAVERLLSRSRTMLQACREATSPGLELGAALGELALAGRDKLTFFASSGISSLPNWIEQLVAESLGKDGKGLVPVVGEAAGETADYGDDRVFVGIVVDGEEEGIPGALADLEQQGHPVVLIRLRDRYDLGAEFVRWEMATAAAAIVLKVQPFDQPNVESSKVLTRAALTDSDEKPPVADPVMDDRNGVELREALASWYDSIEEGGYIAIQAFLPPDGETSEALGALQTALLRRTGRAVTWGYGPRFLHSTGQLHKGGLPGGAFLQLLDRPATDLLIPEQEYSFARVIEAQANGDAAALRQAERRMLRVRLSGQPLSALRRLRDRIQD